jgi:NAD+ kinase
VAHIAFLPHRERVEAAALAKRAILRLEELGHTCAVPGSDAACTGLEPWGVDETVVADGLDLAVCLGGDGTFLRAVELVGRHGVPILGVNVGHLAYLAQVEPEELDLTLDRFLAGDDLVRERMLLEVLLEPADGPARVVRHALNEAVVRSAGAHVVHLEVTIGGELFTTFAADALLVATPTGSTAYNLSARGPIVAPELQALIVTPVAPHQLFDRSLVLGPTDTVRLELLGWRPGRLQCDGVDAAVLAPGDAVVCRRGPWAVKVVSLGRRDFRRTLRTKFGLADR